jgi:hypothetical protein
VVKVSSTETASANLSGGSAPELSAGQSAAQADSHANKSAEAPGVFHPIVTQFGGPAADVPQPEALHSSQPLAEPTVDIAAGTTVDELKKRFGEPVLALTGISGEDYTEKYVFRTSEGVLLTVLSVEGKVTAFVVERDPAARAAL